MLLTCDLVLLPCFCVLTTVVPEDLCIISSTAVCLKDCDTSPMTASVEHDSLYKTINLDSIYNTLQCALKHICQLFIARLWFITHHWSDVGFWFLPCSSFGSRNCQMKPPVMAMDRSRKNTNPSRVHFTFILLVFVGLLNFTAGAAEAAAGGGFKERDKDAQRSNYRVFFFYLKVNSLSGSPLQYWTQHYIPATSQAQGWSTSYKEILLSICLQPKSKTLFKTNSSFISDSYSLKDDNRDSRGSPLLPSTAYIVHYREDMPFCGGKVNEVVRYIGHSMYPTMHWKI